MSVPGGNVGFIHGQLVRLRDPVLVKPRAPLADPCEARVTKQPSIFSYSLSPSLSLSLSVSVSVSLCLSVSFSLLLLQLLCQHQHTTHANKLPLSLMVHLDVMLQSKMIHAHIVILLSNLDSPDSYDHGNRNRGRGSGIPQLSPAIFRVCEN
eukprot:sb/3473404/